MLKKTLKWIGRILLGLAILVALFYIVENARGKYAWEQYKRECAAKGINLDWQSLIPPPIPDDENIAMAPIFQEMFASPPSRWIRLPSPSFTPDPNTIRRPVWQTGRWEGLAPWRVALSNDNLLVALSVYDDDLQEVEEAFKRPSFRLEAWDRARITITHPEPYGFRLPIVNNTLPPLLSIYDLRARAKHEASQYDGMLEDILIGFRIANLCQEDPQVISAFFRAGVSRRMCTPLWLGFSGRVWNAQQLATLQSMLEEINLAEHALRANQFERAQCAYLFLLPHRSFTYNDVLLRRTPAWYYAIPRGWFYQNALRFARFYDQQECLIHTDSQWFDVVQMKNVGDPKAYPSFIGIGDFLLNHFLSMIQPVVLAQATLHQAVIACAIERYRLEHGRIPERLDKLVPHYLAKIPCDPCDGQPMRYKPTGDNNAILYSIGWNCIDDGGELGIKKINGVDVADSDSGDWVWRLGAEGD